jgi:hypothetical protein
VCHSCGALRMRLFSVSRISASARAGSAAGEDGGRERATEQGAAAHWCSGRSTARIHTCEAGRGTGESWAGGGGAALQARRLRTASGKWKVLRGGGGGERRRAVGVGRGCGPRWRVRTWRGARSSRGGARGRRGRRRRRRGWRGRPRGRGRWCAGRGAGPRAAGRAFEERPWLCRWVRLGCWSGGRAAIRLAGKAGASIGGDLVLYHFLVGAWVGGVGGVAGGAEPL